MLGHMCKEINKCVKKAVKDTRITFELCSKLTINTHNDAKLRRSVFVVNFEHIEHSLHHINLLSLFFTLNWYLLTSPATIYLFKVSNGDTRTMSVM